MRYWSVLVSADRYLAERLYDHEMIDLPVVADGERISAGDRVVLVADVAPPVVFAVATVLPRGDRVPDQGPVLRLGYIDRLFDDPRPAGDVAPHRGSIRELTVAWLDPFRVEPGDPPRPWLVSIDLPIEAATPAEAVRRFWTYVQELGPAELPAFVRPSDDELVMRAFVRGDEANLDPEEDG